MEDLERNGTDRMNHNGKGLQSFFTTIYSNVNQLSGNLGAALK